MAEEDLSSVSSRSSVSNLLASSGDEDDVSIIVICGAVFSVHHQKMCIQYNIHIDSPLFHSILFLKELFPTENVKQNEENAKFRGIIDTRLRQTEVKVCICTFLYKYIMCHVIYINTYIPFFVHYQ